MSHKNLSIVASAFLLFFMMLWLTQDHDESAQTATSPNGMKPLASNAKPSAMFSATSDKSRNGSPGTPQHDQYATQSAQSGEATSAATTPARNSTNNNPSRDNSSPLNSAIQAKARVEPTPLEPRADPYALKANSGSVNVRFSVRLIGNADASTRVYLRQSGTDDVVAMNDQGMNGDLVAGDNIHGTNIVLDTSRLAPDTCLNYTAMLKEGEHEALSSPLRLCVSSLQVRVTASDTTNPVIFADGTKAVADEILVTAQHGTKIAAMQALAASINATIVGSIPPLDLYQLKLPTPATEAQLTSLVAQLNAHPEVKGASVNAIGEAAAAPNDPEYVNQHGLQLVRAQDVWDAGATGSGIIVTVLDTGIDRTHPDFGTVGNCQLAENDCGSANTDAAIGTTLAGHGTQVAGVIAAKTNNALGVAGVAPGSKIHSIKLADYTAAGMVQGFTDAATYVSASLINASFYGEWDPSSWVYASSLTALCTSINSAVVNGNTPVAVVVNSVGNNGMNGNFYPARCNDSTNALHGQLTRKDLLITVANSISSLPVDPLCANAVAVDQRCGGTSTGIYYTSNYGAWVDIVAPGAQIRTTTLTNAGSYTSPTGTSFSSPMVAGAAAILKQCGVPLGDDPATPSVTEGIEHVLKASGANVMVSFPDGSSAPRLDIYRALELVNRPPTALAISNSSLLSNLNTSAGAEVGALSKTDPDTCDKWTYSIVGGADAASFSIGGTASDRLILTAGVLNSAVKSSYAVTVRVTDYFGVPFDQPMTVNVTSVNNPPTISNQTFRINESSANGTAVGTVLASDPDSGNVLSYSITAGNTSSAFSINASTGALSVNNTAALAANPTFSLTVTVTDGGGLSANATVTVNVNKAPSISNQTFSINEGSANGTSVGTVIASDAGDTLIYSITASSPSSAFSINSSTGVISVSDTTALIYATNPTFSLTVQVTDSGNLSASATVTVNVNPPGTPANNAPSIANQTFAIDDCSANGTVAGSVLASDPDAGDSLSFSITAGNTDSAFAINPTTGVLSVSNSAAVSYTTNPTFSLTVQVTDNGSLSANATVTVNVNAPTSPPPTSGGGSPSGGGGGCSVMPVGADPDLSLILAVLGLLAYGVRRRRQV
ncbi:MAG: cadherin domain-containing protein [Gammaproteobacteria bacterium]|nr:cadherin domain-containing protein [Gammaproteobacteria bacterium]MBU1480221.1 cadherin domain-containing protein [Gammaproteobacteria bacterium]